VLDRKGHHLQCCNAQHKGTWQRVHEELNDCWIGLAKLAGFGANKRSADMPRPTEVKSDMHADVYFEFHTREVMAVIGDCTITHPFRGAGRDEDRWGERVPKRLEEVSNAKDKMYFEYHRSKGFLFLPLAATTFGLLDPHSIRMIWFLTDCASKNYFIERGMEYVDDDGMLEATYLRHRDRFFLRYKSRVALAVARGSARRAMLRGATRGKRHTRLARPVRELQDHHEGLPLGGRDGRSLEAAAGVLPVGYAA